MLGIAFSVHTVTLKHEKCEKMAIFLCQQTTEWAVVLNDQIPGDLEIAPAMDVMTADQDTMLRFWTTAVSIITIDTWMTVMLTIAQIELMENSMSANSEILNTVMSR